MPKSAISKPNISTSALWVPEGELTIYTASDSKAHLFALLNDNAGVEVDLSGIETLDCAGIQILLVARREAEKLGKDFALTALSDEARSAIDVIGLGHELPVRRIQS